MSNIAHTPEPFKNQTTSDKGLDGAACSSDSVILSGKTYKSGDREFTAYGKVVASIQTNYSLRSFSLVKRSPGLLCRFTGAATLDSF